MIIAFSTKKLSNWKLEEEIKKEKKVKESFTLRATIKMHELT